MSSSLSREPGDAAGVVPGTGPGHRSGAPAPSGPHDHPLLDSGVLEALREELDGDDGNCRGFVQSFITCLPRRVERLLRSLAGGDYGSAMDAVLSLKISSQMVGAERLAAMALDLQESLGEGSTRTSPEVFLPGLAAVHTKRITQCARQTGHLLRARLLPEPPGLAPICPA